jgi:hypothetical protein
MAREYQVGRLYFRVPRWLSWQIWLSQIPVKVIWDRDNYDDE